MCFKQLIFIVCRYIFTEQNLFYFYCNVFFKTSHLPVVSRSPTPMKTIYGCHWCWISVRGIYFCLTLRFAVCRSEILLRWTFGFVTSLVSDRLHQPHRPQISIEAFNILSFSCYILLSFVKTHLHTTCTTKYIIVIVPTCVKHKRIDSTNVWILK